MALILGLLGRFRLQIACACLGLTLVIGWSAHERGIGAAGEKRAEAARLAAAEARAARLGDQLTQASAQAGVQAKAAQAQIVTRTRTIIQRIPDEIPARTDVRLGAGWLRLYNASLGLPEGSGPSAGAADQPGLPSADALAGIASNNAECLKGWDAYERVVTLYDQARAKINGD